ncbi:MAG: carbohydrate kinase family protein [Candidatus Woykebacteria bacterium]
MYDCLAIGAATRDVFLTSKDFQAKRSGNGRRESNLVLPLGAKLSVENIIFETGGGATNAAVTFARQGLRTACITRIGDDPGGRAVVGSLRSEGVDTSLVVHDRENYTGYSIIVVATNGERTILVYRGASAHFPHSFLPKNKLNTKWLFISSLGGNIELLKKLVDWAEKNEAKIALVPGSQELAKGAKQLSSIFSKADCLIMNREEAASLIGISAADREKISKKLCLLVNGIGVITDGLSGATACDRGYFYHVNTHDNKAVERTGAGDAFASGFVAGLIKYGDVEGALELATDNGSSVVNYFGAKKGILKRGQKPFKDKLKVTKVAVKKKVRVHI